jgi:hypothetical protein
LSVLTIALRYIADAAGSVIADALGLSRQIVHNKRDEMRYFTFGPSSAGETGTPVPVPAP